jgi:hypothetical protein
MATFAGVRVMLWFRCCFERATGRVKIPLSGVIRHPA